MMKISRTMAQALHLLSRGGVDWTERSCKAAAYETRVEVVNEIPLGTAIALYRRKFLAVELGPISRSLTFFITRRGMRVIGCSSCACWMRWADSGNHL